MKIVFALIHLQLTVQRVKKIGKVAYGLGGTEKEYAAGVQGVVEQGHEFFLQVAVQVDEQVAAADQVEFGKRRIFDDVLLGKNQHVADAFMDAVDSCRRTRRKKSRQPLRGEIGGNARRIETGPGRGNGPAVNVGGEDLDLVTLFQILHMLGKEDGQRIGLLAGRTTRRPDTDERACRFAFKKPGNDLFLKRLEGLRVAEEIGDADEQITKKGLDLSRRLLQIGNVIV